MRELANPNQSSERVDHAAQALTHAGGHRTASRRLNSMVRDHVGALFGHVVAEALLPLVDDTCEHAGEALYHYAEALKERERRCDQLLDVSDEAVLTIRHIGERLLFRQARIGKPPPNDIVLILALVADKTGSDYLRAPGDERHRHDWNNGGRGPNCRNPLCRATTDEEPF